MLDFIRHMAPELISNKKSATFDDSTLWKLIPSIGSIPSKVASQQSLSPFSPTGKCTLILADTVYFTLPYPEGSGFTVFIVFCRFLSIQFTHYQYNINFKPDILFCS